MRRNRSNNNNNYNNCTKGYLDQIIFPISVVLVLFCLPSTTTSSSSSSSSTSCDQCQFDGNDDFDNCKDYGLIDQTVLVAWPVGDQECLDYYNIRIALSTDPTIICSSSNSFVNELKSGSSLTQAKQGLGVNEGGFFNDDTTGSIKDEITINGITYDCTSSSTSSTSSSSSLDPTIDCYNAMKDYFTTDPEGMKEKQQVCDQIQNKVKNDKQEEQSILRTRLCLESRSTGTDESTVEPIPEDICNPLWTTLQEKMIEYPDKDCTGFSFGIQNMVIPGCEDIDKENTNDGNDSNTSGTSAIQKGITSMLQLAMIAMLFVLS